MIHTYGELTDLFSKLAKFSAGILVSLITEVQIPVLQIISIFPFRKLQISVLQIISIFPFRNWQSFTSFRFVSQITVSRSKQWNKHSWVKKTEKLLRETLLETLENYMQNKYIQRLDNWGAVWHDLNLLFARNSPLTNKELISLPLQGRDEQWKVCINYKNQMRSNSVYRRKLFIENISFVSVSEEIS